jgi:hypothetical protein
MTYAADRPVAMILPLPVAARDEDAVHFLSLKEYPNFFADLHKAFEPPPSRGWFKSLSARTASAAPTLRVHEVGDFVASFVPSLGDFGRLDKRFRLPRQTWNKIPAYRDWGFAVFQLKATGQSNIQQVHPMAFTFPTRLSGTLFFPTVHIHDGQVHPTEQFDHALYFQTKRAVADPHALAGSRPRAGRWLETSAREAGRCVNVHRARGMVWGGEKCFRLNLRGDLPNQDTLIRLA